MTPILTLTNLRKRFDTTVAIDGVSCTIDQPCIFGVVGPDGAGKTTLLRILVGLLDFEAEQAVVLGHDLATQTQAIKARLGYVPQTFSLYSDLSVQHNLEFFADVHGLSRREFRERSAELLAIAELDQFTGFLASTLSGGMKQKLSLICALLHRPQLLILDEPNNGVDIIARGEMWTILRQLRDVTVVMSTGYLDEADRCDQVAYLYHGRIRVQGTPQDIKAQFPWNAYHLLGDIPVSVLVHIRRASWARRVREIGETVTVETALSRRELQTELHACGGTELLVEALTPTLEMVFTELTEQAEQEAAAAAVRRSA
ncbi:MAG: ABC transporter ATP-binding protein [Deltaproteobacteria bacterium]|nr:ABC transporter ATP-binding protein [Deltaproteobacteria bacterium]